MTMAMVVGVDLCVATDGQLCRTLETTRPFDIWQLMVNSVVLSETTRPFDIWDEGTIKTTQKTFFLRGRALKENIVRSGVCSLAIFFLLTNTHFFSLISWLGFAGGDSCDFPTWAT